MCAQCREAVALARARVQKVMPVPVANDGAHVVKANQVELPVRSQCETLRVSTSGYYDWLERGLSARTQADTRCCKKSGMLKLQATHPMKCPASVPSR